AEGPSSRPIRTGPKDPLLRLWRWLWEVVLQGCAVGRVEVEHLHLTGFELDPHAPSRLPGHPVGELGRAGGDIGELEGAVLIGPQIVALALGRAVRLPNEKELLPPHRLWGLSVLGEHGPSLEAGVARGAVLLRPARTCGRVDLGKGSS